LAGTAVALAGCGSSGALTHAQLVSRANAVCRTTDAQIAALPTPRNLQALASYATSTRSATARLQQSLSALHASTSDKPALIRYLAALQQGDALLARIATAAAGGQSATVSSLGDQLAAVPAGALAADAGLSACATPSTSAGIAG
jgi:hypothetical protein